MSEEKRGKKKKEQSKKKKNALRVKAQRCTAEKKKTQHIFFPFSVYEFRKTILTNEQARKRFNPVGGNKKTEDVTYLVTAQTQ